MLGGNHLQREVREFSDSIRRLDSPNHNVPENHKENSCPSSRENRSSTISNYGLNSARRDSIVEFTRLSGELNLRSSKEMNEFMNSVSVQIKKAINDTLTVTFFMTKMQIVLTTW